MTILARIFACLALSAMLASKAICADEPDATVSYLKGIARVQPKGTASYRNLALGHGVSEGDTVVTLADSRLELRLADGSAIRLSSHTRFTLQRHERTRLGGFKSMFNLLAGRFWFNINKLTGEGEIQTMTPSVVAAVKGTVWRAEVGEDGQTEIVVYDGVVGASRKGAAEVEIKSMESLAALPRGAFEKQAYDDSEDSRDDWIKWNKNRDKLRVMIVLPETRGEEKASASVSENAVIKAFMANYLFKVVEKEQVDRIREGARIKAALKGDAAAAAAAGLEVAADLIIVGEASAKYFKSDALGGLISATANLTARAVRADTAEVIAAAASMSARAVDITDEGAAHKALLAAGQKLASEFVDSVMAKWRREIKKGAELDVLVDGVDYARLEELKNALAKIKGVKDVQSLYLVGKRSLLSVTFSGDAAGLAEALGRADFGRIKVAVVGLTAYRLELEVGAREAGA